MTNIDSINIFINSGKYQFMAETESKLKVIRENIRDFQVSTEQKKYQWFEHGVIGIFDNIRIYEQDTMALKDYLLQLGILPKIVSVKWDMLTNEQQEEMKPWATFVSPSIRFNFSGAYKNNHHVNQKEYSAFLQNIDINTQVGMWKQEKIKYDSLHSEWKYYKKGMATIIGKHTKVMLDLGSLSCVSVEPKLCATDVYRVLGKEILLECGTINSDLLLEYVSKGFIYKKS